MIAPSSMKYSSVQTSEIIAEGVAKQLRDCINDIVDARAKEIAKKIVKEELEKFKKELSEEKHSGGISLE